MELAEGARDKQELRAVRRLLSLFTISWPTEADMIRAHTIYQPLRLAYGIKLVDCIIAAAAVGLDEDLATSNVKHFRAVPGLATVQPYSRALHRELGCDTWRLEKLTAKLEDLERWVSYLRYMLTAAPKTDTLRLHAYQPYIS